MTDKATVEIPVAGHRHSALGSAQRSAIRWPVRRRCVRIRGRRGGGEAAGSDGENERVTDRGAAASPRSPAEKVPEGRMKGIFSRTEPAAPRIRRACPRPPPARPGEPRPPAPSCQDAGADLMRDKTARLARRPPARHRMAGIDLRQVSGTGPAGRITHDDLDQFIARGAQPVGRRPALPARPPSEEIKVTGLAPPHLRKDAAGATRRIPHITYVEEVDVTDLEGFACDDERGAQARPAEADASCRFLMRALVRTLERTAPRQRHLRRRRRRRHAVTRAVHIGIATQTPAGLTVPVVRHAEARGIWDMRRRSRRGSRTPPATARARARNCPARPSPSPRSARSAAWSTTPIINHPEVAIVGRQQDHDPAGLGRRQFIPRKMMNLLIELRSPRR